MSKHVYNEQEVQLLRDLARFQSSTSSSKDVLTWAQIAGTTLIREDFEHFMGIVHDFQENSYRQEALMVFIRLVVDAGKFNEARQAAAELCRLEHHVFHALARVRIAKFSKDTEDAALAEEFVRELYESYCLHSADE